MAQWDIRFHTVLAQCTGNSVVHALVPIFTQAVSFFIDITRKGLLKQTIDMSQGYSGGCVRR